MDEFEAHRSRLLAVATRILGSRAEAEASHFQGSSTCR